MNEVSIKEKVLHVISYSFLELWINKLNIFTKLTLLIFLSNVREDKIRILGSESIKLLFTGKKKCSFLRKKIDFC